MSWLTWAAAIERVQGHRLRTHWALGVRRRNVCRLVAISKLRGALELVQEPLHGCVCTRHPVVRGLVPEVTLLSFLFAHKRNTNTIICAQTM